MLDGTTIKQLAGLYRTEKGSFEFDRARSNISQVPAAFKILAQRHNRRWQFLPSHCLPICHLHRSNTISPPYHLPPPIPTLQTKNVPVIGAAIWCKENEEPWAIKRHFFNSLSDQKPASPNTTTINIYPLCCWSLRYSTLPIRLPKYHSQNAGILLTQKANMPPLITFLVPEIITHTL